MRLAHRIKDLLHLPYGLSELQQVKTVRKWYMQSYEELRCSPVPKTPELERYMLKIFYIE